MGDASGRGAAHHPNGAHHLPADSSAPWAARQWVGAWLAERQASKASIRDMSLVVSELVANVVQHGAASEVWVCLDDTDPRWWTLEVGGGLRGLPPQLLDPRQWTMAGPDSSHGRGLGIVRSVVDDVQVVSLDSGAVVRCRQQRR